MVLDGPTRGGGRPCPKVALYALWERSVDGPFVLGDLSIDYERRRVTLAGEPVEVTATEFDLLAELATQAGRRAPHERLLRRVWSPGRPGNLRLLRTHLMHLRRELEGGRRESQVHSGRATGGLLDAGGRKDGHHPGRLSDPRQHSQGRRHLARVGEGDLQRGGVKTLCSRIPEGRRRPVSWNSQAN